MHEIDRSEPVHCHTRENTHYDDEPDIKQQQSKQANKKSALNMELSAVVACIS